MRKLERLFMIGNILSRLLLVTTVWMGMERIGMSHAFVPKSVGRVRGGGGGGRVNIPTTFSTTTTSTCTTTSTTTTTTLYTTKANKEKRRLINVPYGEISRRYRRTAYTHDDWKKSRDPDRFWFYLRAIFKSGVYKNLLREVYVSTGIATLVCAWNSIDDSILPNIGLPITPFTVAAPSLGLLLVFRTNTSYKRWDEARKNWGMNINHTRDLVRLVNTFYDSEDEEQRQEDLLHVALCTWAFVRCMKRHLSPPEEDEDAFQVELYEKLPPLQAQRIIEATHRPNRALQDLSFAVENLPMHFTRKHEVHAAITIFEDNLGSSERLLTSPVPLEYTRHTARYLIVWLLLLPFGLYDLFPAHLHLVMIPTTTILSVFLFGIEELATQMEEPFTILPMQLYCDRIYNWCTEIISWKPGDNGRPLKPIPNEYKYVIPVTVPAKEFYSHYETDPREQHQQPQQHQQQQYHDYSQHQLPQSQSQHHQIRVDSMASSVVVPDTSTPIFNRDIPNGQPQQQPQHAVWNGDDNDDRTLSSIVPPPPSSSPPPISSHTTTTTTTTSIEDVSQLEQHQQLLLEQVHHQQQQQQTSVHGTIPRVPPSVMAANPTPPPPPTTTTTTPTPSFSNNNNNGQSLADFLKSHKSV